MSRPIEDDYQGNRHAHPVDRVAYEEGAVPAAFAKVSEHVYEPPTEGWPAIQYGLQQNLQKVVKSYQPRELEPNVAEKFKRQQVRIANKQEELRHLTVTNQRIVSSVNAKGGVGKTPDVSYLSCIQMDVTRDPVQFIDANKNAGSANILFGISRHSTILLRQAVSRRRELTGYTDHAKVEAKHKSGVRFIGSDLEENATTGFSVEDFNEMVEINAKAFHSLYLDNGNGFSDVTNMGCLHSANALIFSALSDKPSSFEGLIITMIKYIELGFEAKVLNGFIVINATSPNETKQMYIDRIAETLRNHPPRRIFDPRTQITEDVEWTIRDLGISEDRLFLVPFSQHIKDDKVISTEPEVIGYDTYEAFLDILIAMFRQNAYYDIPQAQDDVFDTVPRYTQEVHA